MITVKDFISLLGKNVRIDIKTTNGIYSYRANEKYKVIEDFGNRCVYCFKVEDDILVIEL